jgi:UDP-N-acetylglucosamine 2-epimerase (non-hydrolysing)
MGSRKSVTVFMGTRPEGIKMAPVVVALQEADDLDCRVVATGQHREMFQQVADQFGFKVDVDLGVMTPRQTLAGLTARLMEKIDGWLEIGRPDMALVQGDTTTVLVAAPRLLLPEDPDRPRRGRAPHRGHLVSLPRGGEPPAGVTDRLAPLRSDRDRQGRIARGGRLRGPHRGHRQHGDRRPDDGARAAADAAIRSGIDACLSSLLGADWAHVPMVLITGTGGRASARHPADLRGHHRARATAIPDHRFVYPVHLNPRSRSTWTGGSAGSPTCASSRPRVTGASWP